MSYQNITRLQGGVSDIFTNNRSDTCNGAFFHTQCRQARHILPIGIFLGIGVGCAVGMDGGG